jgi:hypothetical protein
MYVVGCQRLHLLQFLDDFFWFVPFDAHFRSSVLLIIKVYKLNRGGSGGEGMSADYRTPAPESIVPLELKPVMH